jgi:hypothetical protein
MKSIKRIEVNVCFEIHQNLHYIKLRKLQTLIMRSLTSFWIINMFIVQFETLKKPLLKHQLSTKIGLFCHSWSWFVMLFIRFFKYNNSPTKDHKIENKVDIFLIRITYRIIKFVGCTLGHQRILWKSS